jgi:hypothetical protein
MTRYPAFPYRIEFSGATATVDLDAYVAQLVRLVLQTDPGERVNRPTFGGGLKQLVFAGMNAQMHAATETLIHGALLQWLGDVITIQSLSVTGDNGSALVTLTYVVTHTQQSVTQTVEQGDSA